MKKTGKYMILFMLILFVLLWVPMGREAVQAKSIGKVAAIRLSRSECTLEKGDMVKLKASVYPKNTSRRWIRWTSSKESVAVVSGSGWVKAKAYGTATVTAWVGGTRLKASCRIRVKRVTDADLAVTAIQTNHLVKSAEITEGTGEKKGNEDGWIQLVVSSEDYGERLNEIVPVIQRKNIAYSTDICWYENAGGDDEGYDLTISYGETLSRTYRLYFTCDYGDKEVLSISPDPSIVSSQIIEDWGIDVHVNRIPSDAEEFGTWFRPVLSSDSVQYSLNELYRRPDNPGDDSGEEDSLDADAIYDLILRDSRDGSVRSYRVFVWPES